MEVSGAPPNDDAQDETTGSEATTEDRIAQPGAQEGSPPPSPEGEDAAPAAPSITWSGLSQEDRNRLLEEADVEELRKHERISGLAGQMAQAQTRRRVAELRYEDIPEDVRTRLAQEAVDRAEAARRDQELQRMGEQGEFYSLGEQAWRDLQSKTQQRVKDSQRTEVEADFYRRQQGDVQEWAKANYPIEVLDAVRDEIGPELEKLSGDYPKQYNLWLKTLFTRGAEQRVAAERKRWEQEDVPARQDRANAQRAGSERTPDVGTGSPRSNREITDEMIAAMDLDEFKAVWDMKTDRPKEGYTYRSTRGVDPRQIQVAGGSR